MNEVWERVMGDPLTIPEVKAEAEAAAAAEAARAEGPPSEYATSNEGEVSRRHEPTGDDVLSEPQRPTDIT